MLACMGLGALCANGATGPLAALATLVLPPELKSFALSLYEFLTGLLAPSYSVFMGIALQARSQAWLFHHPKPQNLLSSLLSLVSHVTSPSCAGHCPAGALPSVLLSTTPDHEIASQASGAQSPMRRQFSCQACDWQHKTHKSSEAAE